MDKSRAGDYGREISLLKELAHERSKGLAMFHLYHFLVNRSVKHNIVQYMSVFVIMMLYYRIFP